MRIMRGRLFLFILLSIPCYLSAQGTLASDEPGIHDYIFVDHVAKPINFELIREEIGYPLEALKAKVQGRVMCRVLVDKSGKYNRHQITRMGHPILASEVEKHINKLVFEPAKREGQPLDFWINLLFDFDLETSAAASAQPARPLKAFAWTSNTKLATKFLSEARSHFATEDYAMARRMAWSSIRMYPKGKKTNSRASEVLMEAWQLYAMSECQLGNAEGALNGYTEAIALGEELKLTYSDKEQTLPLLYLDRAEMRIRQNQIEEASNDLVWIMESSKNPRIQAKAYLLLSMVYANLHQMEDALNCVEVALVYDPYLSEAAWQKAQFLSEIGADKDACSLLHAFPPVSDKERENWNRIMESCCLQDSASK
ncbi:MAG: energy transducer TonB [Bacteroidota bacterium]